MRTCILQGMHTGLSYLNDFLLCDMFAKKFVVLFVAMAQNQFHMSARSNKTDKRDACQCSKNNEKSSSKTGNNL